MFSIVKGLWVYRSFVFGSVKREFQSKYRNSILGAAWTIIQPLSMIIVYTIIFSQIMGAKLPGVDSHFGYSIYLCTGIITWGLFAEIVSRSQSVFIDNANLLKKLNFPRLCLPTILVLSSLVNFAIIFSLFIVFLLMTNSFPGWVIVGMLPILILEVFFAIGLGVVVGILNVFFRDVGQLFSVVLQFWFWLTPIIYPADILPESIRPWIELNPLMTIMSCYHSIMVIGQWPDWQSLLPVIVLSSIMCLWALHLFRLRGGDIVDEL